MLLNVSRCKYHLIKADIMNFRLIFIFWSLLILIDLITSGGGCMRFCCNAYTVYDYAIKR